MLKLTVYKNKNPGLGQDYESSGKIGALAFLIFLSPELFLYFFDINILDNRLGVLNLQGLAPDGTFRTVFAVFTL